MPIEVMTRVDLGAALRAALDDLTTTHPNTAVAWISSGDDLATAREGLTAGQRLVAVLQAPDAVSGEAARALEAEAPEPTPAPVWIWLAPDPGGPVVPSWMIEAPARAHTTPLFEPADDRELATTLARLAETSTGARVLLRNRRPLRVPAAGDDQPLGRGAVLLEGETACVLATGAQVGEALSAAMDLQTQSISLRVVRLPAIHPLDENLVRECAARPGPLFVTEPGGEQRAVLAQAVEALLGDSAPVVRVTALPSPRRGDEGGPGAAPDPLAEEGPAAGPSARDIRVAVTRHLKGAPPAREPGARDG